MPKTIQAGLDASGLKFALVASRFNGSLVTLLIQGATDCLIRHGVREEDLTLVRVPGAFEIPLAVQKLAAGRKHDAVVALGVLIRGETPHFELIAAEVTRALGEAMRSSGVPVGFGLLTAESTEQAAERAGGKMGNRGWDAAQAALEMARLGKELG